MEPPGLILSWARLAMGAALRSKISKPQALQKNRSG